MSVLNQAQYIVSKLRVLKCSVIEGHPDGWVLQMMFKPYFERYQLIEWILSELKYRVPDVSTNQNSSLRKAENLLAALCALGVLKENDMKIIEGSAPEKDQLRLWKFLVNSLFKKCKYFQDSETVSQESVSDKYNRSCIYINLLCHNVNLKALFKKKVQLFPSQVLKDSKEVFETVSNAYKTLNEIESLRNNVLRPDGRDSMKIRSLTKTNCDPDSNESEIQSSIDEQQKLIAIEAGIEEALSNFENNTHREFVESYANLKPHLSNIPKGDIDDAGPSFDIAQQQLESVTKLNKSVSLLKETEKGLKLLNKGLQIFHLPTEPLSDSLLGEYISILQVE